MNIFKYKGNEIFEFQNKKKDLANNQKKNHTHIDIYISLS